MLAQGPKPKATGLLGVGPQPASHAATIQLPSTEYELDSDDQDESDAKPLSQAELRAKIMQSTAKKEAAKSAKGMCARSTILMLITSRRQCHI